MPPNTMAITLDKHAIRAIERLAKAIEVSNQIKLDSISERSRTRPPTPVEDGEPRHIERRSIPSTAGAYIADQQLHNE